MAKNVVKHIWNEITQLFETVYPRTISSNVLHGGTTVETELNSKADSDHTHSRIVNNLVIGTTTANKAEITLDVSQAGSPQILMTDNEGDNRWAIGADDADNNFSIKGSTSSNPVINNIVNPPLEITTSNVLKTNGKTVETTDHNHDSRYYTESEVNNLLNAKQNWLTNGVNCKTVTGDWNDVTSTGFYMGSGLSNQCSGSSWRYCIVMKHNDLWVSQTMFDFEGTSVYQRNKVNGTWGSWRSLTNVNTWRSVSDSVSNTSTSVSASSKAVKTAYDKANHSHPYASNTHNHDTRYYTESEINTKLSSKSDTSHTHDSRYYTESEINTKLVAKADASHNHDASYYTKTQIDTAHHSATNVSVSNTGWVSSNGQYYKDVSDVWFNGAADEFVNVVPSQASYDNALVLTGHVDTLAGKIRLWATAVPAGTITIDYYAQRGV